MQRNQPHPQMFLREPTTPTILTMGSSHLIPPNIQQYSSNRQIPSYVDSQSYGQINNNPQQQYKYFTNNSHQEVIQSQKNQNPFIEIWERIDQITKTLGKHETQLDLFANEAELSNKIFHEVKKSICLITGGEDFLAQIIQVKEEVKNLKEEVFRMPKLYDSKELEKNQSFSTSNSLSASCNIKTSEIELMIHDIMGKKDEEHQNLLSNINNEISSIKTSLAKMHTNVDLQPSKFLSTSKIVLKYQELLKCSVDPSEEVIVNEYTYYIDNEGFLLDCNCFYIVDDQGKKIKLEEKQLSMLKTHKMIL